MKPSRSGAASKLAGDEFQFVPAVQRDSAAANSYAANNEADGENEQPFVNQTSAAEYFDSQSYEPADNDSLAPCQQPWRDSSDNYYNCGRWSLGASAYILMPIHQNNTAFTTTSGIGAANVTRADTSFTWNMSVSPAVWISYRSPRGVNTRLRYFYFDQTSNSLATSLDSVTAATTTINPAPGLPTSPGFTFMSPGVVSGFGLGTDNLNFSSRLQLQTIDLESTFYNRNTERTNFQVLGGVRYLYLSQSYFGQLSNITTVGPDTATEFNTIAFGHNFSGGGPTMGLRIGRNFQRPGWSVFGSTRGSLLAGQLRQSYTATSLIDDPGVIVGGSSNRTAIITSSSNGTLPVLDMEAGLNHDRPWGQATAFLQAAAVSQTYFGAGNASSATGNNLNLIGGRVSVGVSY